MVARTPSKQSKMLASLNPVLIRETVKKVDKCMARLQELQYTAAGGIKVISGVSLSPLSTRGYLRISLRCKQESARLNNASPRKSLMGKFPATKGGEWKRMSLPAMLVDETVGEILQTSRFARDIVEAISMNLAVEDPKTPRTQRRDNQNKKPQLQDTKLKMRRKREKQNKLQLITAESHSPSHSRVRSRINFKNSPPKTKVSDKENQSYLANKVSPRNRPWAKKTVLFPNPLFLSRTSSQQQFCMTRSPVIMRNIKQTPHKFHVKIKSPRAPIVSISPPRANLSGKKSPKMSTASKLHRSFSPSRLATRLVSPLKSRRTTQKSDGFIRGLKQRPLSTPVKFHN